MERISPGPTRWPPGAERCLVTAKSNFKPQTYRVIGFYEVMGMSLAGLMQFLR